MFGLILAEENMLKGPDGRVYLDIEHYIDTNKSEALIQGLIEAQGALEHLVELCFERLYRIRPGWHDWSELRSVYIDDIHLSKDTVVLNCHAGDEQCLNYRCGKPHRTIRLELESWGFRLKRRAFEHRTRGFTTNSHDRWYGPGSSPTHGGSGGGALMGLAD